MPKMCKTMKWEWFTWTKTILPEFWISNHKISTNWCHMGSDILNCTWCLKSRTSSSKDSHSVTNYLAKVCLMGSIEKVTELLTTRMCLSFSGLSSCFWTWIEIVCMTNNLCTDQAWMVSWHCHWQTKIIKSRMNWKIAWLNASLKFHKKDFYQSKMETWKISSVWLRPNLIVFLRIIIHLN